MATPLTWIEAPTRIPRPNTSLDVLPVHDVSNEHFVGFQFIPEPCSFPNNLPQNCYVQVGPAAGTAKTFNDVENPIVTKVFGAYQGIECALNGGVDSFREIARNVLENGEHKVVDEALAVALAAVDVSLGAATNTVQALALLEQALADNVPAQGYIFVSPVVATYLASNFLLVRNINGTLETHLGTPIVVLTETAAALVAFASGPVNIWRGPVMVNDTQTWTANTASALAERLYSLAIECGVWSATFTAPAGEGEEPPADVMTITLGSIPSSPIPDGANATIIAQTTEDPDGDITLHYKINGGAEQTQIMTQTETHQFVHAVSGGLTGPGDSVELWATGVHNGDAAESNHITIEVV